MSLNLRLLAIVASAGPSGNVAFHIGPDIPFRNQATRSLDARVRQGVQVVKYGTTHRRRYQRRRTTLGDVAKESLA